MATVTFNATVGATVVEATISPTNARTLQFLDDLIAGPYADIVPALTRDEAGQKWLDDLMAGQIAWAKGLRQAELGKAVATADDLLGV